MISALQWYGNATLISISADVIVYPSRYRMYSINATNSGRKVALDVATRYRPGQPRCQVAQRFWLDNVGANSFEVTNSGGTTLFTLNAGECAILSLTDPSTTNGVWAFKKGTTGSASNPPPTALMYYAGGSSNHKRMDEFNQTIGAQGTWTNRADSTFDREEGSCSPVGGSGWFMGGDGNSDLRLVEGFDPNVWTTLTSMPGTSAQGSTMDCASTMTGKAYVFGGASVTLRTLEFDGATWVTKTSRPAGRGFNQTSNGGYPGHDIGNSVTYLLSGGDDTDEGHNFCDSYVLDTYTEKTERPLPLAYRESRAKNDSSGDVFAIGGAMGAGNTFTGRVTKYNGTTNAHTTVSSYPLPAAELMAANYGPKAYLGFGEDDVDTVTNQGYVTHFFEFDMVAQTYATRLAGPNVKQASPQNQACAIPP